MLGQGYNNFGGRPNFNNTASSGFGSGAGGASFGGTGYFGGNNNNFGGGGATGMMGGGFIQSSPFAGDQTTPEGRKGGVKIVGTQGLRPVTIKQVSQATQDHADGPFKVDGKELNQLVFYGVVRDMKSNPSHIGYEIEDGTGKMDVRMFSAGDGEEGPRSDIQLNTYIRCLGNIRSFQGKRSLVAYNIKPVTDFNEVTQHFLNCIHHHLVNTRGPINANPIAAPGFNSYQGMGSHHQQNQMQHGSMVGVGGQGLQERVAAILSESQTVGMTIPELASRLSMKEAEVRGFMNQWCEDGYAYTTVDENHYQVTFNN